MKFLKFAANERKEWCPPCALGSKRVLWSDSMLRGLNEEDFAPDVAVMICSGMSIADAVNVLLAKRTSPR